MTPKAVDLGAVRKARSSLRRLAVTFPELGAPSTRGNRAAWEDALEEIMVKKNEGVSEEQLVVRLPAGLLERVDAYADRLREEQPGPLWRRSEVVRMLLSRALDAVEQPKTRKR